MGLSARTVMLVYCRYWRDPSGPPYFFDLILMPVPVSVLSETPLSVEIVIRSSGGGT